uniref:MULE transposase domain-containing protein n=1 Tax=Lactuca sativa TaxID=4236 RepID=A0A9R1XT94_LACSA|nr:hypothetical protein LSAT_V11C100021010 [Lactuca sativa]
MAIFLSIKAHFQGVFINKPFCYSDDVHHVFDNVDFAEGDPKDDEDDNVPNVKGKPMFDEDIPWKKQLPIIDIRWIGSHFTREVLENHKFNVTMLKEEVKTKFGIEVSMGQCRRAKQHAMSLVEGMCTGQLLCSIGRDGNNHIYPIAWAVVCVENKDNWKWFLENLQEDLHLEGGYGNTLMSDQHKGIIEAVKDLFPEIEHRQCARHACKASTEPLFNYAMKEIQMISPTAYVHLTGRNPNSWSRAFFQIGRRCDAVENGLSESFNNIILDARKKPIISMLEDIRLYVMHRMCSLRYWQVLPSGLNTFETRNLGESYGVDLEKENMYLYDLANEWVYVCTLSGSH